MASEIGKLAPAPVHHSEPPVLDIDIAQADGPLTPDQKAERRIVWNLIKHLNRAGFRVVCVESDDDTPAANAAEAMEEIFNLDEAWLVVRKGKRGAERAVYLVRGNGADIISDWRFSTGDPDGFNAAMEAFDSDAHT